MRVTTSFLVWSTTHSYGGVAQRLPTLIRSGQWDEAFRCYRRLLDGLDLWVADQLRKKGKGTPEEALGNAHQHYAQLRTGLEQIADKHATRLPALFHPDPATVAKERAAGRPAADTVPMNVYFWKDAKDGTFRIYDLTTPSRPHEQTIERQPTAANLGTFFEEVARYPEGEVRYTPPAAAPASRPPPARPSGTSGSATPGSRSPPSASACSPPARASRPPSASPQARSPAASRPAATSSTPPASARRPRPPSCSTSRSSSPRSPASAP